MGKPKSYIPTLDGWRAIAILGVLVAHFARMYPPSPFIDAFSFGAFGVDLFFGISGLLITWRMLYEMDNSGEVSMKGFYIRRFFRILPPYMAYIAMLLILIPFALPVNWAEIVSTVTFTRNYLPVPLYGHFTGHFWSLAVEEHFYLIWPMMFVAFGFYKRPVAIFVLCVGIQAWRMVEFRLHLLDKLVTQVGFYPRTDVRLDGLFAGCLMAILMYHHPHLVDWLRNKFAWLACSILLVVLMLLKPSGYMLGVSLLVPCVLAGTILEPTRATGRVLEHPALAGIGRMSYSLYIWHPLFVIPSEVTQTMPLGMIQRWPLNLVAVFAISYISYRFLEKPLIAMGRRLGNRYSKPRTIPTAASEVLVGATS